MVLAPKSEQSLQLAQRILLGHDQVYPSRQMLFCAPLILEPMCGCDVVELVLGQPLQSWNTFNRSHKVIDCADRLKHQDLLRHEAE